MPRKRTRRWRHSYQLDPGLQLAVEAAGGSMARLAYLLDITPQAIAQWNEVPLNRILEVERVTKVDREQLRPDLYRRRRHNNR